MGVGRKDIGEFKNVDCVVYGHTHKPANHVKDNILFFNPGSAADSFLILLRPSVY
jgi:predicted phosphodiesterase